MAKESPYERLDRPDPATLLAIEHDGAVIRVAVLTPTITADESPVIGDTLRAAIAGAGPEVRHLVLDLERVTTANSMALGMFVSTYTSALGRKIEVILANVPDAVLDLLTMTRVMSLMRICRTSEQLESALAAR